MSEEYLKKVVANMPDVIGRTVYVCCIGYPDLPCKLLDDGSIVSLENETVRYRRAIDLFYSVVGSQAKGISVTDLFLEPSRKGSIGNLLRKRTQVTTEAATLPAGRYKQCQGFSFKSKVFHKAIGKGEYPFESLPIQSDGVVFRSIRCLGKLDTKRRRILRCSNCNLALAKVTRLLMSLKDRRLLCQGLPRQQYQDVISERRWEHDRSAFSLVEISEKRIHSIKCTGFIVASGKCEACYKLMSTLRTIRSKMKRKKGNEEKRLLHSPIKYLTPADKKLKDEVVKKQLRSVMKKLRRSTKKCENVQRELEKYRPAFKENKKAVASIKKFLDEETAKITEPTCRWRADDGTLCQHRCDTCSQLLRHISDAHIEPQVCENQSKPPDDARSYVCQWEQCRRKADFKTGKKLFLHVRQHTGSQGSDAKLEMLREQLINAGREPSGRRYAAATKHAANGCPIETSEHSYCK